MAELTHQNARLPLIDEFDGVCRALAEPAPVPTAARLQLCNHGNVRGECAHFPAQDSRSAIRFNVVSRSSTGLDVLMIEESFYGPSAWRRVAFQIASQDFYPELRDRCQRAQLLAFCRSYLARYSR
jgi:hypothetical protein